MQSCKHCGLDYLPKNSEDDFCCSGCQAVYQLLDDDGIALINKVQKRNQSFNYLDNDTSKQQFCTNDEKTKIRFFVEGVQCSTCLWILESIPSWLPYVVNSRLQMGQDILTVEISSAGSFSQVAEFLWALGYKVRPIEKQSEADDLFAQQQKDFLKRMAVAAFSTGNIMLFSVPIYSEMTGFMEKLFHWISAVIFLPVILYSCKPFYLSLLRFLQTKRINIDIPIIVSVLIGSALSFYNLYIGSANVYFDSLAALVTLILASRVFLRSVQKNSFTNKFLLSVLESEPIKLSQDNQSFQEAWPSEIKKDAQFILTHGQVIPVEARLLSERAVFNPALISGESNYLQLKKADICASGMRVMDESVCFVAVADYEDSVIYKYLKGIEESLSIRTDFSSQVNVWAERFVKIILTFAIGFFVFYAFIDVDEGIKRVLAFVIMACPCSLAFAIPLLESLSLKKASSFGILLKDPNIFERLLSIKNIFFDKTGTLTEGRLTFSGWTRGLPSVLQLQIAYSMELGLLHPIARSFTNHFDEQRPLQLTSVVEVPGVGVEAVYDGDLYSFKRPHSETMSLAAELQKNGALIAVANFQEEERQGVPELIAFLKAQGYRMGLLSGDQSKKVQALAAKYDIEFHSDLSPAQKEQFLSKTSECMFVGDGFNDVGALANADISVTVQGGIESCLKVSDVYLSDESLYSLVKLVKLSINYKRGLKILLGFSVTYNIVFGGLALMGQIGPLVAAVAMPISSFVVVMIALWSVNNIELKNWFRNRLMGVPVTVATRES